MWIGHRKEIRKLTFRALALRRSESSVVGYHDRGQEIGKLLPAPGTNQIAGFSGYRTLTIKEINKYILFSHVRLASAGYMFLALVWLVNSDN